MLLAAGTKTYRYGPEFAEPLADLDRVPEALRSIVDTLTSLGYAQEAIGARDYLLNPSVRGLKEAVRAAAGSAPVVVVYYTGHGLKPERSPYYLLTAESRPGLLGDTALEARQLLDLVLRRDIYGDIVPDEEQPQVLVILDCCFSGAGGIEALKESLQAIGNPNVGVLASASSVDYAQQGRFAAALRQALLNPETGPSQRLLSLDWIAEKVKMILGQKAPYFPPGGQSAGLTPFFPNRDYKPDLAGLTVADQQHWLSRARGGPAESSTGFYLTGRTGRLRAAEDLATWMTGPDPRGLALVTGSPGTGKSALLALPVLLTEVQRRQSLLAGAGQGSLIAWAADQFDGLAVLAVHARGMNTDQVAQAIAGLLGRTSRSAAELLEDLDESADKAPQIVIVDALDEARAPGVLLSGLLLPLARRPELRVVIGTRRHAIPPPEETSLTIDLDLDSYRDPQALADYARQLLVAACEKDVPTPYRDRKDHLADTVAAAIAEKATARPTATGQAESFLLAQLLARAVRGRGQVIDVTCADWADQLPANVGAAFDEDLARLGDEEPLARALLTALAWANGPGLPWDNIWVPVAQALAEDADQLHITNDDVRWLFRKAGAYVVEDLGPGERSVYRPYHHLLAAHLRGEPNTKQRRSRAEQRITDALLATVPVDSQGRRDWRTAHPYLRTYLGRHVEAARPETAAVLAHDPGFLPVADPVTFSREQPGLFNAALIKAAEQARSFHGTHPWWFEYRPPDHIDLWLRAVEGRTDKALAREYVISCGAALFNLRLAIRVAGRDLAVWLLPKPNYRDPMNPPVLLASVEIVTGRIKKLGAWEQDLYEAIEQRHTDRWPYRILPAPLPIIAEMEDAAAREGASLRLLHPRQARKWMRKAARADKSSAFKPPFPDFVASDAEGPRPKSYVRSPEYPRHPRTRRDFWDDKKPKRRFERNVQLMALSTDDDETVDWLRAGQALQRAILTGTRYGLSVSFLTQPLERDDIAGVARRWSWQSLSPEFPQVVIRVGYATVPTPAA